MAIDDIADEYFTYDSRLASFQTTQPVSKRRASNASSKAPKSIKWPHKSLSPETLARAGFFFYPTQANPDNVACFLCHRSMDGWEEDDDPLVEHLKHSPDCGWAIVASIEQQEEELSQEYPASSKMIEARKSTFGDKWPHEGKKGWKCKVKQMVDAGWKYTPTPEYDDMATCAYCQLALDGWEPSDKPLDEHFKRSPDCSFFTLINSYKQDVSSKKSKSRRVSKASRLSIQSVLTVASEAPSFSDLPAEEDDSILTTATNAIATKKMTKGKKSTTVKSKKTRSKKGEPVEVVPAPEPEDDDFEVKVDTTPKATKGKKRKSEPEDDSIAADVEAPPAKRRATRARGSAAVKESMVVDENLSEISKPVRGKGRPSKATRKTSTASAAPLRAATPDDEAIDRALEADLERLLIDEEDQPGPVATFKKSTRQSKVAKADHAMFDTELMEIDEAAIEAELQAMEVESKPLPKAKGAKGKQPRKVSAKQQAAAAAKKAAEAEAQRIAEEGEASQQIAAELEHSISMLHSSPIIQPKKQRTSRQPAKQRPGKATRGSVMSVADDVNIVDDEENKLNDEGVDSGHETDASMASQSTVVRGGPTRRGSTLKKAKAGKKVVRNIEEIVHRAEPPVVDVTPEPVVSSPKGKRIMYTEEGEQEDMQQIEPEPVEQPAILPPAILPPTAKPAKAKTAKPRGRPPKVAVASPAVVIPDVVQSVEEEIEPAQPTPVQYRAPSPPRLSSPPPKDLTPSQSPQSSDAENHPPSSKPSATTKTVTPQSHTQRIPLAPMNSTPKMSPSKRNVIAGLQSTHPWRAADLDMVFLKSPGAGNENTADIFGAAVAEKVKNGDLALTSPEKKMSVEEWVRHNAEMAEERLRSECERMVGAFEREGTRAMAALEGVECVE